VHFKSTQGIVGGGACPQTSVLSGLDLVLPQRKASQFYKTLPLKHVP